jgi:hypothetical protein
MFLPVAAQVGAIPSLTAKESAPVSASAAKAIPKCFLQDFLKLRIKNTSEWLCDFNFKTYKGYFGSRFSALCKSTALHLSKLTSAKFPLENSF